MAHIAPWFPKAKFGVFIHWLLKSEWKAAREVPDPVERAEAVRQAARRAAQRFSAARFDPRDWARMFRSWGARYAVLTTKHHIGFALFDCPGSPFTAANASPARRDLVAEYAAAMRAEGLKVGFYYSLPDWSHPDYASMAGGDDPLKYAARDDPARWDRFVAQMFAEVRHLCTAYGKVDLLWFDGDWERTGEQWRHVELVEMIERLQPGIVLNNRLRHAALGHYGTPEQCVPLAAPPGWWELCLTPGANWDGALANEQIKPPSEIVRIFGDVLGMGGNFLLNTAPDDDGTIPKVQTDCVGALGRWIVAHAEAVHGADAGLPAGLFSGASTRRGAVLYLIAYDQPRPELVVKGLRSRPVRVTHLVSGRALGWRISGGRPEHDRPGWLYVALPPELMDEYAAVVRVEFAGDVLEVEAPGGGRLTWRGRPGLTERAVADARPG